MPDFFKPVKSVKSISLLVLASLLTQRIKKESDTATLILLRKAFILCNEIATEIVGNTKQGLIYLSNVRMNLATFELFDRLNVPLS